MNNEKLITIKNNMNQVDEVFLKNARFDISYLLSIIEDSSNKIDGFDFETYIIDKINNSKGNDLENENSFYWEVLEEIHHFKQQKKS